MPWRLSIATSSVSRSVFLLFAIQIVFIRFGRSNDLHNQRLIHKLDPLFPAAEPELNWLLCETLAYLQSPSWQRKALLATWPRQHKKANRCARPLPMLRRVPRPKRIRLTSGGDSRPPAATVARQFWPKYIEFIRNDAVANLSDEQKAALREVLEEKPVRTSPLDGLSTLLAGRPRTEWAMNAFPRRWKPINGR